MTLSHAAVEPTAFRSAMGHFVTGVTILTSAGQDGPTGMTVNSLTSVSLHPCQLLVCVKTPSLTGDALRQSRLFAINLLADNQKDLAMRFARPHADRFEGVPYDMAEGAPLICGSLAHLVCAVDAIHASGDHEIVVGNVLHCQQFARGPLVFYRGGFGSYAQDA